MYSPFDTDSPARDTVPLIDFRAQLNDEQFNAITAEPGPLLVLTGTAETRLPG